MPDGLRAIEVDEFLPHPPRTVWRALTEPELLARWLAPNDFALEVGRRFSFRMAPIPSAGFDGVTHCRVVDFEPERMLKITWVAGRLDTTVTWTLRPEGRGTRLFTVHDGFDPDDPINVRAHQGMAGGWRSGVARALRHVLSSLEQAC